LEGFPAGSSLPLPLFGLTGLTYLCLCCSFKNVTGSIPDAIGQLSQLTDLHFGSNEVTGSIPASLSRLLQLSHLSLSPNRLSGTIPASLSKLTQLNWLALSGNYFSGAVPSALTTLKLTTLLLNDNPNLMGKLPNFNFSGITACCNVSDVSFICPLPPDAQTCAAKNGTLDWCNITTPSAVSRQPWPPTCGKAVRWSWNATSFCSPTGLQEGIVGLSAPGFTRVATCCSAIGNESCAFNHSLFCNLNTAGELSAKFTCESDPVGGCTPRIINSTAINSTGCPVVVNTPSGAGYNGKCCWEVP
jgi:hypothetical protein